MKKRLLALILCLVMVIGLVPTALAFDDGKDDDSMIRVDYLHRGDVPTGFADQYEYYNAGDTVNTPSVTAPEGYTFDGWYFSSDAATKSNKIENFEAKEDAILIGFWTYTGKTDLHHVTYKQSKDDDTDKIEIPVEDGQETNAIFYPESKWTLPDNTLFAGWTDGTNTYQPGKSLGTVTADITLWATYKNISVLSISYFDYETQRIKTASVKYGDSVTINPGKGAALLGETPVTTAKAYTITESTTLTLARTATKTALGWTYDPLTKTFTAVWENVALTHTVKYVCYYDGDTEYATIAHGTTITINPNGGSVTYKKAGETAKTLTKTTTVTVDKDVELSYTDYKWNAYYFDGWKFDGKDTFVAQWTKDYPYYKDYTVYYYDYDEGKYAYAEFDRGTTLVFDANGGSAKLNGTKFTSTKSVDIAQDYTLSDAERAGYTFYGWDLTKSGSKYYFTAMWARKSSTVPYMLNGSDHFAYIKGYPNGTIRPDATITRAEVATIFYRLLTDNVRKNYGTTKNSFKDVPANAWYNTAVSTIANLGIITGDANGYFRPTDSITRAELAAMIARCDGGYYTGSGYYFSDTKGHWAADYIARAYDLGWINGYGDTYAPDRKVTRAETMAVLNRVLNRAPQYTSDLLNGMNTFSDNQKTSAWYYLDVQEATNSHTYTRKTNSDYEYWNKLVANPSWY